MINSIPSYSLVGGFKYFFTPSVENLHTKGFDGGAINIEYIILTIPVWTERIGNVNWLHFNRADYY